MMLDRLLPKTADNRFTGYSAALGLLWLFVVIKLVMGVNSISNTASVAGGADGIPLESYGPAAAQQVLILFALTALGQLVLALVALIALMRYRALVPFLFLVMLAEQIARRLIVQAHAVTRTDAAPIGVTINYAIVALLALGLILSLIPKEGQGDGRRL